MTTGWSRWIRGIGRELRTEVLRSRLKPSIWKLSPRHWKAHCRSKWRNVFLPIFGHPKEVILEVKTKVNLKESPEGEGFRPILETIKRIANERDEWQKKHNCPIQSSEWQEAHHEYISFRVTLYCDCMDAYSYDSFKHGFKLGSGFIIEAFNVKNNHC